MLNGTFGVGKTATAQALVKAIPSSLIFDPENIGYVLRRLPAILRSRYMPTDDYQDAKLWRRLTINGARIVYGLTRRTLIVPMMLANPAYLAEIKGGLESISPPLYHFCLTAPLETIQARLLARGDRADSWSWRKTIEYAPLFDAPLYGEHIDTAIRSIPQVIDLIVSKL